MIDRGRFLRLAVCGLLGLLVACEQASPVRRIGYLVPGRPDTNAFDSDIAPSLAKLGWIVGKNLVVDYRFGNWQGNLDALAVELVQLKPDLIITEGTGGARAAKKATATIPVVMASGADPVAMGIVTNLARPGGNITGYSIMGSEVTLKRAQLVHEALPAAKRVAFITPGLGGIVALLVKQAETTYRSLGLEVIMLKVEEPYAPGQYDQALAEAARGQAQVVEYWGGPNEIIGLALARRLALIASDCELVGAGALLCLEFNQDDRGTRVASIIDKVLRGANPGEIAIEQPTRFTMRINMKTASALGIAIPQSVILRADEVIR